MSENSSVSTCDADRGRRKTRVGVVLRVPHPKFHKIVKKTTKLYAADEKSEAKVGDRVRVTECRPLSKLKRWRLVEVLKH
jgi:small subunit ribosomal protein S17